ncbi:hypothetical protein P43SY_006071 [Pythium insidiosum]|uniref:C2 domain-containing protein n=1 Tax=Pythium insidiosum TaxID=114742 RepID=A0AAD5Q5J2_PYTIN|nr:hypothetical protein P43SY_006071 [Pythium insidiosum]
MAPAFPVPREELPQVHVSGDEYLMRKRQMQRMVAQLVHEFECYSTLQKRQVDHRRWKQISARENLRLYKERAKPRSSAMLSRWHSRTGGDAQGSGDHADGAPFFHSAGVNMAFVPMAPDTSRPRSASVSSDDGTAATASMAAWRLSSGSSRSSVSSTVSQTSLLEAKSAECTAEKLRPLLLVGQCPGQVQDAMHAVVTHSQDELAMVVMFLHEDVADCAILHTMEAPTEAEPYRYLGYKWFVKPSPAASRLLKNRDSLYVEYSGITKTRTGDVVGFHIMHSIDIPGFPEFRDRNCVRAAQSIRTLYHQVSDGTVEVFMMGNIEIGVAGPRQPMTMSELELADAQQRHAKRAKSSETVQNESAVSSARDLPVSDSMLEGRTSDPFVVFKVRKEVQQSSCILNNLNPQWIPRETFDFPIVDLENDVLDIQVLDHDTYNAHDLMATLALPVSKFMSNPNSKHKESFDLDVQADYSTQACRSVIDLEICLQTDARGEVTHRIWENHVWFLTTGWVGSDTEIYKNWSAYDDSVTSNRFEDIAPPTPEGFESSGWGYVGHNRGEEGWMYGHNFLGPFSATKGLTTCVHITLSRATELLAADTTGTSDPYVAFRVAGQSARSTILMKTLDPVWSPPEQFQLRVMSPFDKVLEVEVIDHDWLSADDTLGKVQIPLGPFIDSHRNDQTPEERGYKLEVPKTWFRKTPNSSIYLAISVQPVDEADCVLEVWENEYWTPSGGWQPASEGVVVKRGRWSNDDGSESGDSFEKVMPRVIIN